MKQKFVNQPKIVNDEIYKSLKPQSQNYPILGGKICKTSKSKHVHFYFNIIKLKEIQAKRS